MKKKNIVNFFGKILKALDIFLKIYLIIIFAFFALFCTMLFTMVFSSGDVSNTNLLTIATTVLAINIALAAMVFTYASNYKKDQRGELLIKVGDRFVISSIAFLFNLSLMGLLKIGYIDQFFHSFVDKKYLLWFLAILIVFILLVAFIYFLLGIWQLISIVLKTNKN